MLKKIYKANYICNNSKRWKTRIPYIKFLNSPPLKINNLRNILLSNKINNKYLHFKLNSNSQYRHNNIFHFSNLNNNNYNNNFSNLCNGIMSIK